MAQTKEVRTTVNSTPSDAYPSRQGTESGTIPRQEPVVYGSGKPPIDPDHIAAYETNGFLFLPSLFSAEEVAVLFEEMDRLQAECAGSTSDEVITEKGSGALRSLFRVHEREPVFSALAADSRIVDIVRFILGSDVYIHQSRINFKPGFTGKDFYWHSDFETWHIEDGMPGMRAVSVSILLTESNECNGALMLIPRSHKTFIRCVGETPDEHYKDSLRQQEYGVPDTQRLTELVRAGGIRVPKGPAGSVVLFDCNTMHGSNSNISPYPRGNVFYVYNSMENRLGEPLSARAPRPEFIATRAGGRPVQSRKCDYGQISRLRNPGGG